MSIKKIYIPELKLDRLVAELCKQQKSGNVRSGREGNEADRREERIEGTEKNWRSRIEEKVIEIRRNNTRDRDGP